MQQDALPGVDAGAQAGGVAAVVFLLVATAAWWALALWPLPGAEPEWLERARWVCFNARPDGLPDASGWLLLVGQPIGMLAVLMAVWGGAVRAGLRSLARARWGRAALAAGSACVALGLVAAGTRVVRASGLEPISLAGETLPADTYPRLDREAPELGLLDQSGKPLRLEHLRGRPALVTFAFAHCETVCPLVVRDAREAQRRVREGAEPSRVPRVVVVTLDPWRDTPSRLPHLAQHWELSSDGFVLSGDAPDVNRVLDAWNVPRERDTTTGDVTHPPLVYVLDRDGRITYAASGGAATLVELLDRS